MMEATAIWNDATRRDHLISVTADLMGRTAARLGVKVPERHWDFNWGECCDSPCDVQCGNRHHCPDKLMSTGLWQTAYVPRWNAARIDELRRMSGTAPSTTTSTTTTAPPFACPLPKGMSASLAGRFYNPSHIIHPVTGKRLTYSTNDPASIAWRCHVLSTNPAGKTWRDYLWPALLSATKRGDGRVVLQFSDGWVWQEAAGGA